MAAHDQSLTIFLEHYSRATRLYRASDAAGFVSELLRRWRERRPLATAMNTEALPSFSGPGSVFLSYAHEDHDAARQIFSELENDLGAGVPWFDQRNLLPGNVWENHIPAAIKSCDLFLALLSANTERRQEGVFRNEWRQAIKRRDNMSDGRTSIIPVVIDETCNVGDYREIPPDFARLTVGHAPLGKMSESLRKILKEELRKRRRFGTS